MPGLYHKLHGSHRPVAMKKSTIKRRKRVVPAYPDAGNDSGLSITSDAPSNAEQTGSARHPASSLHELVQRDIRASERERHPPTIDFTGYNPDAINDGPREVLPPIMPPSKKRSLSTTTGDGENASGAERGIRSESGRAMDEMQLDPALVNIGRRSADQEESDRESYKAEKRARLLREAEGIRELLRAKEKELADLR
jgi:GATA-binding protein, other eukaryote